jgi:hypothetical protein
MSKTVDQVQGQKGVDGVDEKKSKEELEALLLAQGMPMIEPGRGGGQANDVLSKAGLGSSVGGISGARGATAVDSVDKSQGASQAGGVSSLYGPESTQIAPPSPPKVEMNEDLRLGAETFVNNMDQIVNQFLFKDGAIPQNTESMLARGLTQAEAVGEIFYGLSANTDGGDARAVAEAALMESQTGLGQNQQGMEARGGQGAGTGTDSGAGQQPGGLGAVEGGLEQQQPVDINALLQGPLGEWVKTLPQDERGPVQYDSTGSPIVPKDLAPEEVFTGANLNNIIQGLAANGGVMPGKLGSIGGISPEMINQIANATADQMLALFMKLNITDPNNSVETHNSLHEIGSELRLLALDEGKAKGELAKLQMENAQKFAQEVKNAGTSIMIITIIISIIITIFTFGAAAGAAIGLTCCVNAAIQAGVQIAQQTAMQIFINTMQAMVQKFIVLIIMAIVVTMLLQIMQAGANKESADKTLDAQQAENGAERARNHAEKHQAVVEEEAAIMKLIMESKNQVVDAVMKMMNAMFATQQKVMASGKA